MFPYGRSSASTPKERHSGSPKRPEGPVGDKDKPIHPYFSRLFASPSARSNNFSFFSYQSSSNTSRSDNRVYRELPPSLFNFQSPFRRPIQSLAQTGSSRPRTATEFLKNATSTIFERALQKFESANRKRPCEALDDEVSVTDRLYLKRYRGHDENNSSQMSSQNAKSSPVSMTSQRESEIVLPRLKLKPTSSTSRPSSAKLPQQVSRLSSATLEAIAFATKRQRSSEAFDNDSQDRNNFMTPDDNLLAPPSAKKRVTRDCETQTVLQVDSSTCTRESSPSISDHLPRRRPPNMTSVSQLFARLEAKARATSSNLRLAALRKIGSGLRSSSLEDRQAHIRRIFEELTDKDGLKFGEGPKLSLNNSMNISDGKNPNLSVTGTSVTLALSTPPVLSPVSVESTSTLSVVSSTAASSSASSCIASVTPSFSSFGKTLAPEKTDFPLDYGGKSTTAPENASSLSFGFNFSLSEKPVGESSSSISTPTSTNSVSLVTSKSTAITVTTSLENLTPTVEAPKLDFITPATNFASSPFSLDTTIASSSVPTFNFPSKPAYTAAPSFSFPVSSTAGTESTKPVFNFTVATETPLLSISALSSTTSPASSSAPLFSFSASSLTATTAATPTTSTTPGINFLGKSVASTTATTSTTPLFNFSAIAKSGAAETTPAFSFSANSTSVISSKPSISTPVFGFSAKLPSVSSTTATGTSSIFNSLPFSLPNSVGSALSATTLSSAAASSSGTAGTTPAFGFSFAPSSASTITTATTKPAIISGFTAPAFSFFSSPITTSTSSFSIFSGKLSTALAPVTTAATAGFNMSGFNFSVAKTTASSALTQAKTMPSFCFSTAATTTSGSLFSVSANPPATATSASGFSFTSAVTASSNLFGFPASLSTASTPPTFGFPASTTAALFAFNKTGLTNGVGGNTANPFGIQNPVTTSVSAGFGFAASTTAPSSTATTMTTGGFNFSASPKTFQFGASQQTVSTSTSSGFSLNLPSIKSSPSIFSIGDHAKRTVDFAFNSDGGSPAKISFGSVVSNPTPSGTSSFAFGSGGAAGVNSPAAGGFNFNAAAAAVNSPIGSFNFGASTTPVFGSSGQASPNPFSTQPTIPNAAASFQQRRRQMRITRRR